MNYGKVEEPSSSRNRFPSTARFAATSAILMVILSRSDRAPISNTVNAGLERLSVPMYTTVRLRTGPHEQNAAAVPAFDHLGNAVGEVSSSLGFGDVVLVVVSHKMSG